MIVTLAIIAVTYYLFSPLGIDQSRIMYFHAIPYTRPANAAIRKITPSYINIVKDVK